MIKVSLFLIFSIITFQVHAQNLTIEIDELLNDMFDPNGPGAVALVVKDGKTIYRKAFGMANIELGVKMTPEHTFRIGSITKQFTAVAILKLAEEGKLKLDDNISKYIKDYPTHGHKITIKHLLNHTSGIKNYTSLATRNKAFKHKGFTPKEMINFFKDQPMDFSPGEQYRYNNSGYFLLGYIIEQVSGQSYESYINNNIFQPLNMHDSFYNSATKIIKNRTAGYEFNEESAVINADYISMTQPYAAGALRSSVDDLYTWNQAVMNDKIISKKSRDLAHKRGKLNDGTELNYGYGWFIGNIQGESMIFHDGGIDGFFSESRFLPNENVFVALLVNCGGCKLPYDTTYRIAAMAINKPFQNTKTTLSEQAMSEYPAVYLRGGNDSSERQITSEAGKLYSTLGTQKQEIFAVAKDHFIFATGINSLIFNRNNSGTIDSVTLKSIYPDETWDKTDKPLPKLTAINLPESLLTTYIGFYELRPDFIFEVIIENGTLYLMAPKSEKREMVAVENNHFYLKGDSHIRFTFNTSDKGVIESMTAYWGSDFIAKKIVPIE